MSFLTARHYQGDTVNPTKQSVRKSCSRRLPLLAAALISLLTGALMLGGPSALALRGHVFSAGSSFGGAGAGAGQLALRPFSGEPAVGGSGVAVDDATGDVYVADTGNHRIDEFDPSKPSSEQFIRAWGWGVANGKAELETCTTTCRAGLEGHEPGQFETPAFVAVDNSAETPAEDPSVGDVYIGDTGDALVTKFTASGALVKTWGDQTPADGQLQGRATPEGSFRGAFELSLAGITVDPVGSLWVYGTSAAMFAFEQGGALQREWHGAGIAKPAGIAVDGAESVYLDGSEGVEKHTASGELLGRATPSPGFEGGTQATGLAVDQSSNDLYVGFGDAVEHIAPPCEPTPTRLCAVAETFGSPELSEGAGLAVTADETVYVANASTDTVDAFPLEGPSAPTVEGESVADVSSDSATLAATVDPRSLQGEPDTEYTFEYGPCATAGTCASSPYGFSAPEPDGDLPPDFEVHAVTAHPQGLQAGTSYHFRVVARNSHLPATAGAERTFTTQSSGGEFVLPDGRQYEMVSPPEKQGANIAPIEEVGLIKAARNGDALTFVSGIPTEAEPLGFSDTVQNLAVRGAGGWSSRDLTVPHMQETGPTSFGSEYKFFSEDLSLSLIEPLGQFTPCTNAQGAKQPCLSEEASEQTLFLSTDYLDGDVDTPCLLRSTPCDRPLVSGCPAEPAPCAPVVEEHANVPPGTVFGGVQQGGEGFECAPVEECGPRFIAATPDLSHVVLQSDVSLTPGAGAGLYEWTAGRLTFIGRGEHAGETEGNYTAHGSHGISADGSRVVFRGEGGTDLLMRDTATGETVELNPGLGEGVPQIQTASADDSRVFFSESGELYVFEVTAGSGPLSGRLTSLTNGAGVVGGVLGASEDGSYVYFVSDGTLAGSGATGGGDHLYVDRYVGGEWKPTFIATLSSEDSNDWSEPLSTQPTRVSPNGEWLAFMSQSSLTGYDNRDAANGDPDAEVYLYHAGTGALVCASCDPTGARPVGVEYFKLEPDSGGLVGGPRSTWSSKGFVAANLPGTQAISIESYPEGYQSRYLSDGGRLFFDSADALVSQDVNGTEDVYQYEPQAADACSSSTQSGSEVFKATRSFEAEGRTGEEGPGCVALISSGDSSEESAFLDASEDGSDVFFLTTAKLASQDVDTAYDIYDAHECSAAAPCSASTVSPPPCDTEASCRPSPTPQPSIYGLPSSATFAGPGNVAPAKPPSKTVKAKTLTKAQRLADALRVCRKDRQKARRAGCEKQARKKYGAKQKQARKRHGAKPKTAARRAK
jgi:hypothetical protein